MVPRPAIYNKVLGRLRDNAAEDTIQMGEQVRSLMDHPGWGFVQDFLTQMAGELDVLVEQGVHQQAEYAAMIAERRTLRNLQAVADAIVEAGQVAEKQLIEMASQMEARGEFS